MNVTGYCHLCRVRYYFTHTCPTPSASTPLATYAGHEQMSGRLRATNSIEFLSLVLSRENHDTGD